MAIECTTCGAVGESFFSTNDFGDLVCDLCGTQSFLQARNETQDMDDLPINTLQLGGLKRVSKRKRTQASEAAKRHFREQTTLKNNAALSHKFSAKDVQTQDVVQVCEQVLVFFVQSLQQASLSRRMDGTEAATAATIGFPTNFKHRVVETWREFVSCWEQKATKPLLDCFVCHPFAPELRKRQRGAEMVDEKLPSIVDMWYSQNSQDLQDADKDADAEEEEREDDTDDEIVGATQEEEGVVQGQDDDRRGSDRRAKQSRHKVKAEGSRSGQTQRAASPQHTMPNHSELFKGKSFKAHWLRRPDFDAFILADLLAIILIATRKLNLGILPCDLVFWIENGSLPYNHTTLLYELDISDELLAKMEPVRLFFNPNLAINRVTSPARISWRTQYLEFHMGIELPPLNASLAALRIVKNLGLPMEVFGNFQLLTGCWNHADFDGDRSESLPVALFEDAQAQAANGQEESKMLDSAVGIVAHLLVAIKMTPFWYEWAYEFVYSHSHKQHRRLPSKPQDLPGMMHSQLDAFVVFCQQSLGSREVAEPWKQHVSVLNDIANNSSKRRNGTSMIMATSEFVAPAAFPVRYDEDGDCLDTDDTIHAELESRKHQLSISSQAKNAKNLKDHSRGSFFPCYQLHPLENGFHGVYEQVFELLCEYIDASMANVMPLVYQIDWRLHSLLAIHKLSQPVDWLLYRQDRVAPKYLRPYQDPTKSVDLHIHPPPKPKRHKGSARKTAVYVWDERHTSKMNTCENGSWNH